MYSSYIFVILSLFILVSIENTVLVHGDDPTDGFTSVPLTEANFEVQKPYNIPIEKRYSFIDGVHRFWVYAHDKPYSPDSPTQPRTEIRIKVIFPLAYTTLFNRLLKIAHIFLKKKKKPIESYDLID
jgi:hypothetical protein